ncbi:MAG: hypothetical protein QOH73_2319, partial [Gaiellaceae bacterium]|nr:hypothetical protein [Gaiellaceae bacterium]
IGAATDPTETEEERLRRIRPANYEAQIAAARHAEPMKRSQRGRRRGWM